MLLPAKYTIDLTSHDTAMNERTRVDAFIGAPKETVDSAVTLERALGR